MDEVEGWVRKGIRYGLILSLGALILSIVMNLIFLATGYLGFNYVKWEWHYWVLFGSFIAFVCCILVYLTPYWVEILDQWLTRLIKQVKDPQYHVNKQKRKDDKKNARVERNMNKYGSKEYTPPVKPTGGAPPSSL